MWLLWFFLGWLLLIGLAILIVGGFGDTLKQQPSDKKD